MIHTQFCSHSERNWVKEGKKNDKTRRRKHSLLQNREHKKILNKLRTRKVKDLTGHNKLQRHHLLQFQGPLTLEMDEARPPREDDIYLTKVI